MAENSNPVSTTAKSVAKSTKSGWKRRLLIVLIVLLVIIGIPIGMVISVFIGKKPLEAKEFGADSVVKDGFVAVGVIDEGNGHVALIDAGDDESGKAILAELARRKLGPDAVSEIFLTHGHPDHVAAAKLFPNANVYIGIADMPLAQGRASSNGVLSQFGGKHDAGIAKLNGIPFFEQTIPAGNKSVRAFLIPGHTNGSAAYLVDGLLFLGDSANANSSGQVSGAPYPMSDSVKENHQSLKKLAEAIRDEKLEVKELVFAHSGSVDGVQPLDDFVAKLKE